MVSREISLYSLPANRADAASGLDRLALIPIIVGFLTAASIILLVYQEHRAVESRIEATEAWSAYQVKIVQTTIEEDPNLKTQYTEEQDLLRRHAQDLKEKGSSAKDAVVISAYAALVLLLGAATAVFGLIGKSIYVGYAGLLVGTVGVGLAIRGLF